MKIRDFGVEQWMNDYENLGEYNLAETCVQSLTTAELLDITGKRDSLLDEILPMQLTYGAIPGSDRLRTAIAALYERQGIDNVLVAHGAIGANHLTHLTLVEPGDRIVSVLPTYQQHYSVPESIGADVRVLRLCEENDWLPDLADLAELVGDEAKLVAINNPNNPTGSLMDEAYLQKVVEICDRAGAYLLCDEVYRGVDHDDPGTTASVADLYERGISTGSMSKAFSLAGLRLGWVAGPQELVAKLMVQRDYSTISVGMIDDLLSAYALEHADAILARNRALVRGNHKTLSDWIDHEPHISWVEPAGGTTAFLKYDLDVPSRDFCVDLVERTGVILTPGSAFDVEGYLRIGYANSNEILVAGLERLSDYLARI